MSLRAQHRLHQRARRILCASLGRSLHSKHVPKSLDLPAAAAATMQHCIIQLDASTSHGITTSMHDPVNCSGSSPK